LILVLLALFAYFGGIGGRFWSSLRAWWGWRGEGSPVGFPPSMAFPHSQLVCWEFPSGGETSTRHLCCCCCWPSENDRAPQ